MSQEEPPEDPNAEPKDTFHYKAKKTPWWEVPEEYAKVTANPTSYLKKPEEEKKKEEKKEITGLDGFF